VVDDGGETTPVGKRLCREASGVKVAVVYIQVGVDVCIQIDAGEG